MDEKYKKRYESFQKSLKVMKDILIQYETMKKSL